jgi:hypothetical protein
MPVLGVALQEAILTNCGDEVRKSAIHGGNPAIPALDG